ncbi:hypothetical protein M2459_000932 [Parabacteroides sp. PF5-5]|uniref:hypothetical protein n=1 Tax=unclassified Parabacteroides TaxID=2649774 RepID=UPI0024752C98|nr:MULTISPECIES: hypothetical protein [unclassified Parabacteroides]MDH6304204.1 hypothetical protein [Parabacteroides sp. PH5-39]MDH6315080.1 hypothetical protein [Parabacteroides sp. PF5-13]MDH6318741.1 hypothetical protein [Parabacteroides sp. PH5-13]MDH6322470.1 hypothetical protein [Parabacteroides sp. PH5-8]MDH6326394.1 hypothetical protein [Parabacteroides sp. PH5-41]
MTLQQFYQEIETLLPVKRESDDFRADLSKALSIYSKTIKNIDPNILSQIPDWATTEKRIEKLIDAIKLSVKHYYEGMYSTAFSVMRNQLLGHGDTIEGIMDTIGLHTVRTDEDFYRGRTFENNRHKTHDDMFHIKLQERGKITTQRYSAPGYPCLYLGSTIFACWEELGEPRFDDLMISAYKATRNFKLFDLRIPKEIEYTHDNLRNTLLRLPLIIACSFVLRDKDKQANFKPEYIIPHLLIELIIKRSREDRKAKQIEELILGVIFTSTHISNEFMFPKRVFDNIAIPALDVSSSDGYCNILSWSFKLTDPTCYEYEEIKSDFGIDAGHFGLTEEEQLEENYILSKMGRLEERLKNTFEYKQFPYVIPVQTTITIPADGGSTSLEILSNTDWEIKTD